MRSALGDPPFLPRQDGPLLQVGQEVSGPVDFNGRHEFPRQVSDPVHQIVPLLDAVECSGVHPAVLVHQKVGVGCLQQGVVLRRLNVQCGVQDLPAARGSKMTSVRLTYCHKLDRRRRSSRSQQS